MNCPVCSNEIKGVICRECGFDESMNCEKYPTIAIYKKIPAPISKRAEIYIPKWNTPGISRALRLELLSYSAWNGLGRAQKDLAEYYYDIQERERFEYWKNIAERRGYKVECSANKIFNDYQQNDQHTTPPIKSRYVTTGICAGGFNTVRVCSDGTCVSTSVSNNMFSWGQNLVGRWTNIDNVSIGKYHTVGLKKDGRVISTIIKKQSKKNFGQTNVSLWDNIISVCAGEYFTVGLKKDGTIVFCGDSSAFPNDISRWSNLSAISSGYTHILGLRDDGTVVSSGDNKFGQCDVALWKDIVAISAGYVNSVGLKKDGTVVATQEKITPFYNIDSFSEWKNIKTISSGGFHTVGLKRDGTVVACGDNRFGQCSVALWKDIVYVSAGLNHTVGLRSNGEIVVAGDNSCGQCNINELFA